MDARWIHQPILWVCILEVVRIGSFRFHEAILVHDALRIGAHLANAEKLVRASFIGFIVRTFLHVTCALHQLTWAFCVAEGIISFAILSCPHVCRVGIIGIWDKRHSKCTLVHRVRTGISGRSVRILLRRATIGAPEREHRRSDKRNDQRNIRSHLFSLGNTHRKPPVPR